MKKIILTSVLIFTVGLLSLSTGAWAGQEVVIKDMEPFSYAYMGFGGSFDQMGKNIGLFMQTFFKQGLTPVGPPLGIFYNDPTVVKEADLKWAIGFPVADGTKVAEPLIVKKTTFKKAAVYLHIGPYEESDKAYEIILKYIDEKGYKVIWPTFEKYLNDPQTVKPQELQSQIIVPVEKK